MIAALKDQRWVRCFQREVNSAFTESLPACRRTRSPCSASVAYSSGVSGTPASSTRRFSSSSARVCGAVSTTATADCCSTNRYQLAARGTEKPGGSSGVGRSSAPEAERGIGDDRQAQPARDWEHFAFGALRRVVADHDRIEQSALRHLGRERPLMAGDADPAHHAVALRVAEIAQRRWA